jgi:hypothetical protein
MAYRLVNSPEPAWMKNFYRLHTNWSQDILDGLTYFSQLSDSNIQFWVDGNYVDNDVAVNGTRRRIWIPSTILFKNAVRCDWRQQFFKYLASQIVEDMVSAEDYSILVYYTAYLDRFKFHIRGENLVETHRFEQFTISNKTKEELERQIGGVVENLKTMVACGEFGKGEKRKILGELMQSMSWIPHNIRLAMHFASEEKSGPDG